MANVKSSSFAMTELRGLERHTVDSTRERAAHPGTAGAVEDLGAATELETGAALLTSSLVFSVLTDLRVAIAMRCGDAAGRVRVSD